MVKASWMATQLHVLYHNEMLSESTKWEQTLILSAFLNSKHTVGVAKKAFEFFFFINWMSATLNDGVLFWLKPTLLTTKRYKHTACVDFVWLCDCCFDNLSSWWHINACWWFTCQHVLMYGVTSFHCWPVSLTLHCLAWCVFVFLFLWTLY